LSGVHVNPGLRHFGCEFILVTKLMYERSNARIRLALKVLACYDFGKFGKKETFIADDLDSLRICLGRDASRMSLGEIACAVIERELDELKKTHLMSTE
jgi:hypothetical protein